MFCGYFDVKGTHFTVEILYEILFITAYKLVNIS